MGVVKVRFCLLLEAEVERVGGKMACWCVEGCVGISLIRVAGVGSKAFQEKHGDQKPEVSGVYPSRMGWN